MHHSSDVTQASYHLINRQLNYLFNSMLRLIMKYENSTLLASGFPSLGAKNADSSNLSLDCGGISPFAEQHHYVLL